MRKRRSAKVNTTAMNRTVSLTDGEWDAIGRWSAERGKSRAEWMRECALTAELAGKKAVARPLVLDAGEQRHISRTVQDLAVGLAPSGDEADGTVADDLRALLVARLRAMVREGRREAAVGLLESVLGGDRAAIVAEALIPEPQIPDPATGVSSAPRRDDRPVAEMPLLLDLLEE